MQMILPFMIVLPGFVFSQSATIFNSYFSGIGRPDLLPKIALVPLVAQVGIALVLMPSFGVVGAAVSFLLSSIALSLTSMIVFSNLTHIGIQGYIISKSDVVYVTQFVKSLAIKIFKSRGKE